MTFVNRTTPDTNKVSEHKPAQNRDDDDVLCGGDRETRYPNWKTATIRGKPLLGAYKVLYVCNEIFLMLGGGHSASPTL